MIWITCGLLLTLGLYQAWKLTARSAYDSPNYQVTVEDGDFELREYPDLLLVTTPMRAASRGRDGSFGRLFQYISGSNAENRKIAMTVPVLMDMGTADEDGRMGFVVPESDVERGVPEPASENVQVQKRSRGQFATMRFSGRMNESLASDKVTQLREWMAAKGLTGSPDYEVAGYDPPWVPGPLRRNEVVIRVVD